MPERDKVTISILPSENNPRLAGNIQVGTTRLHSGEVARLSEILVAEQRANPNVKIDLRAYAGLDYAQVQPIMAAISQSGVSSVRMVAKTED